MKTNEVIYIFFKEARARNSPYTYNTSKIFTELHIVVITKFRYIYKDIISTLWLGIFNTKFS